MQMAHTTHNVTVALCRLLIHSPDKNRSRARAARTAQSLYKRRSSVWGPLQPRNFNQFEYADGQVDTSHHSFIATKGQLSLSRGPNFVAEKETLGSIYIALEKGLNFTTVPGKPETIRAFDH